jgi:CBS domain-containing protein
MNAHLTREIPALALDARTAADLMTPNPVSIQDGAPVKEAAAFLTDKGVSAAPVINEAGAPIGVLSQTDLVVHAREQVEYVAARRDYSEAFEEFEAIPVEPCRMGCDFQLECVADRTTARDVMTPAVFSVSLDAPAARVVEDMLALKVHRLFVIDAAGVLVGVISALDVLRRLRPAA